MKWCAPLGFLLLGAISGCFDRAAATSGQVGCSPDEVQIDDESSGISSETWSATCHGEKYFCSLVGTGKDSGQVACHAASGPAEASAKSLAPSAAAAPASPPKAAPEPPTAVAGFTFGSSVSEASSACTEHGYEWQPGTQDHFRCSGMPTSIGVDATPVVRFCGEKLCAVSLQVTIADGWFATFGRFNQVLVQKYGAPASSKGMLASNCSNEASFLACIMTDGLSLVRDWKWDTRAHISLRIAAGKEKPDMKIIYVREAQHEANPDAL